MFAWNPKKNAFTPVSGKPKYYCNKCKGYHIFGSKKSKEHVEYGEYPNFPFLPGNIIINIPKRKK